MKKRFNAYVKTTDEFLDNILVVCPNCGNKAIVQSKGVHEKGTKMSCASCGANKYYAEVPKDIYINERSGLVHEIEDIVLGKNIDPYFHLPLWLQKEMSKGILWAYNYEHLEYMENHIGAELRYRHATQNQFRSLGAILPKWMTAQKNRKEVLNTIKMLKQKK